LTIDLSHLGEPLVAAMLRALASRQQLERVVCAASRVSLAEDLPAGELAFIPDKALLRVHSAQGIYACDGSQTVDVLAAAGERAVALELKLGLTRMTFRAFRDRFCDPCCISAHEHPSLNGSMVAVLDRLLPFDEDRIEAFDGDISWTLTSHWWLVVRRQVWQGWRNKIPVESARILDFDSLASIYGRQDDFDRLVRETVGADFAQRWDIQFAQP